MEVYTVCFRVLGRRHDAEDATQETFLALFRDWKKVCAAVSPRAWILTVARNTAVSFLRSRRSASPLVEILSDAPPVSEPADLERLDQALAALTEEERGLIELRFLQGKSPREMAREHGRTPGSVATALCRALGRLRGLYHGANR